MPETRVIEKYGILKLLPEDRGAQNLIVLADVIQLPYSEYLNTKSNPPKGHYGYACFMYKEYVREIVDIQFRRQVIFDWTGYVVQLAHQEYCNSKEIAQQVGSLWNPTPVEYPIINFDEIRFRLEPGVVLSVFKSSIPMKTCDSQGIVQPDLSPPSSYQPPPPEEAPPKDTPVSELIPLTSPYEGEDDSGNTYVRDIPPPVGSEQGFGYKISVSYQRTTASGTDSVSYVRYACGPVSYELKSSQTFPGKQSLWITSPPRSSDPPGACPTGLQTSTAETDNPIDPGTANIVITKL